MTMDTSLGAERTGLLVIDMQHGFVHEKGSMAQLGFDYKALAEAVPGCEKLVAGARSVGVPVFFTRYVYEPDFRDGGVQINDILPGLKEVNLCVAGTWDAEITQSLQPLKGEIVIEKNRPSSFYATRLEVYLRSQRINRLVLCGVTTNICVETTARDAAQRDYRTFVVRDAVGEVDPFRHEVALKALEHMFAKIVSVDDVLQSWGVNQDNAA